jgi:hypothetical protein
MAKRKKLSMSSIEMRMSHRYRSYGFFCATLLFSTIREGEERWFRKIPPGFDQCLFRELRV